MESMHRKRLRRLNRLFRSIALSATIMVMVVAMVALLPVLLPYLALSEWWEMRSLARTRCSRCGNRIGAAEIRRAREAAFARAWAHVTPGAFRRRRRIVAGPWEVRCSTCGQAYSYDSQAPRPRRLVPVGSAAR